MDYRATAAAAALSITVETLRRNADDAGINVERRKVGSSMARIFHPADLFKIARWRAETNLAPAPSMPAVASVWGAKGGIGKTTMCGNLAVAMGFLGLRVLVIDLDFQSSLSLSMGYDSELEEEDLDANPGVKKEDLVHYTIGNLLPDRPNRQSLNTVLKKPYGEAGPHLIPADLFLDRLDGELMVSTLQGISSDLLLSRWISAGRAGKSENCNLSTYDLILFDCPPSINRLTRSALLASDTIISPVNFEHFSTKALSHLSYVIASLNNSYERSPDLLIFGNAYDAQRIRSGVHIATITRIYKEALIQQSVRRSEDFLRVMDKPVKMPLLLAKPTSSAAEDVRLVAKAIAYRMNLLKDRA